MRTPSLLLTAAALLSGAAPAAADLTKVDRTIKKEPAYKSKPHYCLLVFGPEAKTRVWLVVDGDTLYVDRNGNGDLTDEGEKVARKNKEGELPPVRGGGRPRRRPDPQGAGRHPDAPPPRSWSAAPRSSSASRRSAASRGSGPSASSAERPADDDRKLPRHIGYVVNGDGQGWLAFARRPQDAPVIHFNGPWTLEMQDNKQRLTAGHETMLQIGVGTAGVGPGTFTWVLYPDTIPADAYPVAEVTFPPRTAGEKPITRKYTLKERC